MLADSDGVVNVLVLEFVVVCRRLPPVDASYQLNVPFDPVEALRETGPLPHLEADTTEGTLNEFIIVAVTAFLLLMHVPLSNCT